MVQTNTTWMGLSLRNPLVASASPLTRKVEGAKRLADAGVGAIVMYSLFEEQFLHESKEFDHFLSRATHAHPEALDYFPDLGNYNLGPDEYLKHLEQVVKSVDVPVVGSLNGCTKGGWTEWAKRIEEAGAQALELNVYQVASDPDITSGTLEEKLGDLVVDVASRVKIPVSVKLSPFFTSLPNLAWRITLAGAKGVTLFNRFLQPDLDPDQLAVVPQATLSSSDDLRLPLRWTAILAGRVPAQIALSGGVHNAKDFVKAVMAGAQVVQVASELLQNGPQRAREIVDGAVAWMTEKEYDSFDQMRGSMSQAKVAEPWLFERAHYMKALSSLDDRFV
ncbi:MAG: dihydroorotate dehydrogenase-like protein [Fibrobacteria bacterium]|nr:dihydroorotate dehydrogenase-like protein [Fibrobacteria bacterium]